MNSDYQKPSPPYPDPQSLTGQCIGPKIYHILDQPQ